MPFIYRDNKKESTDAHASLPLEAKISNLCSLLVCTDISAIIYYQNPEISGNLFERNDNNTLKWQSFHSLVRKGQCQSYLLVFLAQHKCHHSENVAPDQTLLGKKKNNYKSRIHKSPFWLRTRLKHHGRNVFHSKQKQTQTHQHCSSGTKLKTFQMMTTGTFEHLDNTRQVIMSKLKADWKSLESLNAHH